MVVGQSDLLGNLIVVFIMVSLVVLIYCKIQNKTLAEVFMEFKEMATDSSEEII